jgi:hypothetical protein
MRSIKINSIIILSFLAVAGCKRDIHEPLSKNTTPPGVVSNVSVVNQHGKATLNYKLPADQDLAYVKAVYDLSSGQKREVKASYYTNTMVVDGFGDTAEHEIKLYAVNTSEVPSEPVIIKVKPLENPIWGVFRSLEVVADFGGIKIKATNTTRSNIAILPMTLDVRNDWALLDGIYTSTTDIDKTIRGLDTVPKKFAITVRDRFLNFTDTLFVTLTPLYETALSKSLYKAIILPGDANANYWSSTNLAKMWDGNDYDWPSCAFTDPTVLTPQWLTFDLGQTAQLSRIVIWDYPEYLNTGRTYYYAGDMRKFEIWGSNNPSSDGSWANWTKLGTYEQIKPSGSAYASQSDEDFQTARAGFSWSFRVDVPKFRYVRIKNNQNWVGTTFMTISEVQVYGDPR